MNLVFGGILIVAGGQKPPHGNTQRLCFGLQTFKVVRKMKCICVSAIDRCHDGEGAAAVSAGLSIRSYTVYPIHQVYAYS